MRWLRCQQRLREKLKHKADSYAIRFRASDFHFSIEKRIGLLMQSDSAKSDRTNLIRESDGPSRQISAQNLMTQPITKSKNCIGL